jgi:hypothetical protein
MKHLKHVSKKFTKKHIKTLGKAIAKHMQHRDKTLASMCEAYETSK